LKERIFLNNKVSGIKEKTTSPCGYSSTGGELKNRPDGRFISINERINQN